MITIRDYAPSDHENLVRWHKGYGINEVPRYLIPPTTYLAECNGKPVGSVSLILTNCHGVALIENLIGDKEQNAVRDRAIPVLIKYAEEEAKKRGIRIVFMNAIVDKLKTKYESFGYRKASDNLSMLIKEL